MTQQYSVDGILFDLDGTLLDTIPDLVEASNRMLQELGQPPRTRDEIASFVGDGIRALVQRAIFEGRQAPPDLYDTGYPIFNRHYAEVNGQSSQPFPGVMEALGRFRDKGMKMGCVTNKSEVFIAPVLAKAGIGHFFDSVVGGDTLPQRKPDPAPLLYACRQLGIDPWRALMVGDSPNDALAARRAGIPVLLLTYGYCKPERLQTIDCDGLIPSLEALRGYLSR